MTANAIGWALLSIGVFLLLRTAWLDRRLQRFRAPDAPAASYLGRFGRWRLDLYTPEGQALRAAARQAFALFCVVSLLAVLILESVRP
jgi:hypothetical protein